MPSSLLKINKILLFNIKNIFFFSLSVKGFSKLLVCGGYSPATPGTTDNCELIDLKWPAKTCQNVSNFPMQVVDAFGGLGFKQNPIICGGSLSEGCYSFENNEWISADSMTPGTSIAAAVQLQNGQLLVTGGSRSTN
jgi:hypothetical protein